MSDIELIRYLSAMAQGHVMMDKGLITEREFMIFEEKIRQKYGLPANSIYRDYRLLYQGDQR